MQTQHYTQDLKTGDRVRLKPYPEIIDHLGDHWVKKLRHSMIKAIAGKAYTIDRIEDGHVRLIGHQYGAFWAKLSAVKERWQ